MSAIRLAQITDTHLMPTAGEPLYGLDTDATLSAVLERVMDWEPDLIVATGDLSEHGDPSSYQRLKRTLEALGPPVYLLPGNHDRPEAMRRWAVGEQTFCEEMVDLGGWRLHLLDSTIAGESGGRLDPPQLVKLAERLTTHAAEHQMIFLHHHPRAVGSPWMDAMGLQNPEEFLQLAGSLRVKAVACGHVHQSHEYWDAEPVVLTTPATSSQARPRADRFIDDEVGPGFRWFQLQADGAWSTGVQRVTQTAQALSAPPRVTS